MQRFEAVLLLGLLGSGSAALRADYAVSLVSQNAPVRVVAPGESFDLDLVLASDRDDYHNAVIIRLEFSAPGLVLESYQWFAPYGTANGNDDTKPGLNQLPAVLSSSTLSGTGYPQNVVDLELSNVTGLSPGFASGRLVKLGLKVPLGYAGPNVVRIRPVPDTIVAGFSVVPARTDPDFLLAVAPPAEPVARVQLLVSTGSALLFWPSAVEGCHLEATDSMAVPARWTSVQETVFSVGDRQAVVVPAAASRQFFRLRKP